MLYVKPIDHITWEDVEAFCEQGLAEGAYLDYKQDFPSHLERTVAAMANTFGGMVLIGVAEDDGGRPVVPVVGIPFQRGLSERVMSLILANIVPPVFPDIAVCCKSQGDRALVLIRIPQSHATPHAITGNTKVYLRTGNRNAPEDLARIDEIEWLREHRRKSQELHVRLRAQAMQRCASLHHEYRAGATKTVPERTQGWLRLFLCPLFPQTPLETPPGLRRVWRQIQVDDYHRGGMFPDGGARIVQDGLILNTLSEDGSVGHVELNVFGLYFVAETAAFEYVTPLVGAPVLLIRASDLFARLDQFLDSGIKYYRCLSYWGPVEFHVRLDRLHGCGLGRYRTDERETPPLSCPDGEVEFTSVVPSSGSLPDQKRALILAAMQKIAWAFGWDLSQGLLDAYYTRYKRSSGT